MVTGAGGSETGAATISTQHGGSAAAALASAPGGLVSAATGVASATGWAAISVTGPGSPLPTKRTAAGAHTEATYTAGLRRFLTIE